MELRIRLRTFTRVYTKNSNFGWKPFLRTPFFANESNRRKVPLEFVVFCSSNKSGAHKINFCERGTVKGCEVTDETCDGEVLAVTPWVMGAGVCGEVPEFYLLVVRALRRPLPYTLPGEPPEPAGRGGTRYGCKGTRAPATERTFGGGVGGAVAVVVGVGVRVAPALGRGRAARRPRGPRARRARARRAQAVARLHCRAFRQARFVCRCKAQRRYSQALPPRLLAPRLSVVLPIGVVYVSCFHDNTRIAVSCR